MKNKLIVMFLTFLVMIVLTPYIFNKLMNAKFNSMIVKISQQKGIQIKEIKDKSSYLTTDRIFDVVIPGKAINQNEIKTINLQMEVKFKNLPVTNVTFKNILEKIVLQNNKTFSFDKKIRFVVITPDFKVFRYRLNDNQLVKNNLVFSWSKFGGIFNSREKELKNLNGILEVKNKIVDAKIFNIKALIKQNSNKLIQQFGFDANISLPNLKAEIADFNVYSSIEKKGKKLNVITNYKCKNINVNNLVKIDNVNAYFELDGLNGKIYKKLLDKTYSKDELNEFLKEGFGGKINLNIKNIFFMQNLGFADLKSTFKVSNATVEKINKNDLSFLDLNLSLHTSPNLIKIADKFLPGLIQLVSVKNNKVYLDLRIDKGKIFINGKEIKSN